MSGESPKMSTVLVDLNSYSDDLNDLVEECLEQLKDKTPFKETKVIGEGGMGSVSLVQDKRLLRQVALKHIHPDKINLESVLRFIEEAQITAKLEHPNIIPVYGLEKSSSQEVFYSMKFIEGENLKSILNRIKGQDNKIIKKFPLSRLLDIFLSICDAVSYACSRGIVHRDLKPDNIMIGEHGKVYLVDWGLAKNISDVSSKTEVSKINIGSQSSDENNLTTDGFFVGTPKYMAPERFSEVADEQTEVFALGAILYNILTLKQIVKSSEIKDIVKIISSDEIETPEAVYSNSSHLPSGKIPAPLSVITMKALAPAREDRYKNVKQLTNEIKAWQNGLLTEAEKSDIFAVSLGLYKRYKRETLSISFFLVSTIIMFFYYIKNTNDQTNNFLESELQSKLNSENINQSSLMYEKSSYEVSKKIEELQKLAPEFYENATNALKRLDINESIKQIDTALSLEKTSDYFFLKAYAFFLKEDLSESTKLFNKILTGQPKSEEAKSALKLISELGKREIKLNNIQLMTKHVERFRPSLLKPFQTKTIQKSQFLKNAFLKSIKGTDLDFINSSMLRVLKSGNLAINLNNTNLTSLETLRGLPIEELQICDNAIKDLSPLKGMPLRALYITNIKTNDLNPLRNLPLEIFQSVSNEIEDISPLVNMPLKEVSLIKNKITSIPDLQWSKITKLDLSENPLKDIHFLQNMPTLKMLALKQTFVNDLSPLSSLNIESLDISECKITSILALKGMPLKHLSIANNEVNDLRPVNNCPLKKLIISNTKVKDLSPIKDLPLIGLDLRHTLVSDITPIKNSPLKILFLQETKVKDISAIKDMGLEEIHLHPESKSLEVLQNVKTLKKIFMQNFKGKNLPDLSGLKLQVLNLRYSKIEDISGIRNCYIRGLDLSGTRITDFSPLEGKTFEELNMQNCNLSNIAFLSKTNTNILNLCKNSITNITPLHGMNLVHLNIHTTNVSDLSSINQQPIVYLNISNTKVTDLSPLKGMPLNNLNAQNTDVVNLSPLEKCRRIRVLDLSHTAIKDLTALRNLPITYLYLENCSKLNDLKIVTSIDSLFKIIVPDHIKDLSYLREGKLRYIGTKLSEVNQPAHVFWNSRGESLE